ncbi:hypothetical protein RFN57_21730 [Streptomyces violaceochromogenes]|uniref:DUF6817 domain-containing protein n=1 Tax=Streptomyces violaceochromogenes TaxID=67377 RepID=A0ABU6LZD4_9ACTN|nr:hypothetical protein [Streptomyces violaceochromogenes]MEC7054891.1 hypothetical protein [Streptomyces violaceochromogenes]
MPASPGAVERAVALLRGLGAADIAHPGGTLLAHLRRVQRQLAAWDARPALQLAGLCHAFYGTDGFPEALLPLDRRGELAAAVGAEAESLVYLYASCDRGATYPTLADADGPFHDRFTGLSHVPEPQGRRDFAELSAANETDLARLDPAFRDQWGSELLGLFTRVRPLLSQPAWSDCQEVFAG